MVLFLLLMVNACLLHGEKNVFLFDSHSRNSDWETGLHGTATLIEFSSKVSLELIIISNFVKESDSNIPIELQCDYNVKEKNKSTATDGVCKNGVFRVK